MSDEACRIGIVTRADGAVDVGAPMQHKQLCYEILRDARRVMEATSDEHFRPNVQSITIVMGMDGGVDVGAPLPWPRHLAYKLLDDARDVIERFDDESAPEMRPFNRAVMGGV